MWVMWWLACAGSLDDDAGSPVASTLPGAEVVTLTTSDGVALAADYLRGPAGAPGVCLFHMIPPSNDRTNWPADFVASLHGEGWAVLVVDRRGAGDSAGVATEAYEGPNGKLDVDACMARLAADGAGPLAILGASNGTTAMLDYTVWAKAEGLVEPVAVGFLTGGTYTENQNRMDALGAVPAVFTFSTEEAAWSDAQRARDPGSWVFHEYPGGAHGTRMFAAAPEVADDLIAFLQGPLAR